MNKYLENNICKREYTQELYRLEIMAREKLLENQPHQFSLLDSLISQFLL